jgi:hypothetical protein
MSYYSITWRGLTPLGGSIVSVLAQVLGTRTALATGGIVVIVVSLVIFFLQPHLGRADSAPEQPEPARPPSIPSTATQ